MSATHAPHMHMRFVANISQHNRAQRLLRDGKLADLAVYPAQESGTAAAVRAHRHVVLSRCPALGRLIERVERLPGTDGASTDCVTTTSGPKMVTAAVGAKKVTAAGGAKTARYQAARYKLRMPPGCTTATTKMLLE